MDLADKLGQGLPGLAGTGTLIKPQFNRLAQGTGLFRRQVFQYFQGFFAHAPGGNIDNPQQTDAVPGVVDHPQIGQQVLDFSPVVKAEAADNDIGHPLAAQGLFQDSGLGVGAIKNRVIRQVPVMLPDPVKDEAGFLVFVIGHIDTHQLTGLIPGP